MNRTGGKEGSQRLDFHSLGDLQIFAEFLKRKLIISIEKDDRAQEGNAYRDLGNVYFSLGDHPLFSV